MIFSEQRLLNRNERSFDSKVFLCEGVHLFQLFGADKIEKYSKLLRMPNDKFFHIKFAICNINTQNIRIFPISPIRR